MEAAVPELQDGADPAGGGRSRNAFQAFEQPEKQGLIQAFAFTHELAWNVLKDFIENQGYAQMTGSRDATREAFRRGLIDEGERWMEMIASRNQTTHTYNQATADAIAAKVENSYYELFERLKTAMEKRMADGS